MMFKDNYSLGPNYGCLIMVTYQNFHIYRTLIMENTLHLKGQLMVSTSPERTNFLDVCGAQGSHPKTGLSKLGKTHLCP